MKFMDPEARSKSTEFGTSAANEAKKNRKFKF